MSDLPAGMRWCPDCNGDGVVTTMDTSPDMNEHEEPCTFPGCAEGKGIVPIERLPVWTEPPQLTQIRQWEAGTLYPEHDIFSFGHGFGTALVDAVDQLRALVPEHDDSVETPGVEFIVEWRLVDSTFVHTCHGFTTIDQASKYADELPSGCRDAAVCRVERTIVRP